MRMAGPSFDDEEIDLLRQCLASGWVTQGPLTERFERLIGDRHGAKYAIATTSCTSALHLATAALGLGPKDEVIVPAFTWITSANAAEYVGAKAVFADVNPNTFNLDPAALEAAITPNTRAIMVVHLFGLAAEMDSILAIARRHGLAVIEDAACAIGTQWRGKPVGSLGDLSCFSFHPRKVITTGEGGMVLTNDDALAAKVRSLRNHGSTGAPSAELEPHGPWTMATFDNLGFNFRLSDIQAAVGVAQVAKLEGLLAERQRRAKRYSTLLSPLQQLQTPDAAGDVSGHTYQSYVIRLLGADRPRRNAVMEAMASRKIETRPGTHAVHRLGYYARKYNLHSTDFPNAALCEDTTITLPIFPGMTDVDQDEVVETLTRAIRS